MLCSGFVQTSQKIYVGAPVANVSSYGGPQFTMSLNLTQVSFVLLKIMLIQTPM